MGKKGVLSKAIEEKLGQGLDDLVKLNGFWEQIDGLAFKLAISAIDDTLGEKIPEPYKSKIAEMFVIILEEEDYEKAVELAFDFGDEMIDIPGIDDEMEAFLFEGMAKMVLAAITALKKKDE